MNGKQTDYLVARRFERFKLEIRLRITPVLRRIAFFGHTLEVSCCGLSTVSAAELSVGEIVDLAFNLADCEISVRAAVRHRTWPRAGLEAWAGDEDRLGLWILCYGLSQRCSHNLVPWGRPNQD